jgi:hypothetical protein
MKRLVFAWSIMVLGTLFAVNANAQFKKIGMKKAREIASGRVVGKIKSSELEKEHGKWIYSFDIHNAKGTITEVNIDAYTGKVVSVEEEIEQKEAAEKKAERAEKKRSN